MFYSNDDATAFTADMVKIKELTPENVLNALADKGVIDKDIKINKFEVSEVDGMQSINIDFDQKFKEYIMSCGSTQEYYVVGGICNYFHLMGNLFHIKLHTINMVITVKSTVHAIIFTIVCNIKRCKQIYCISEMLTCLYFRFLCHLL